MSFSSKKLTAEDIETALGEESPGGGGSDGTASALVIPLSDPIEGTVTMADLHIAAVSSANFPPAADNLYKLALSLTEGLFVSVNGTSWSSLSSAAAPPSSIYTANLISAPHEVTVEDSGDSLIGTSPLIVPSGYSLTGAKLEYRFMTAAETSGDGLGQIQIDYLNNNYEWSPLWENDRSVSFQTPMDDTTIWSQSSVLDVPEDAANIDDLAFRARVITPEGSAGTVTFTSFIVLIHNP